MIHTPWSREISLLFLLLVATFNFSFFVLHQKQVNKQNKQQKKTALWSLYHLTLLSSTLPWSFHQTTSSHSPSSQLKLTLPCNHMMACFPHRLLTMAFNANIIPTALHWFGLNHFFSASCLIRVINTSPATEPNHLPFPGVPHPVPPPSQSSQHLLNLECQSLILAYLLIDFPDPH